MAQDVDSEFETAGLWHDEALALRAVLKGCGLDEALKWGKPCYSHDGGNICIIQRFRDFLALMFFKGALVDDPDGILAPQGPNSRSGYRVTFNSLEEVEAKADAVRACAASAIEVERRGLKIEAVEPRDLDLPDELVDAFDTDPDFRAAFEALTPGRQRGYVLHFAGAKQAATRTSRIETSRTSIFRGKGLQDR